MSLSGESDFAKGWKRDRVEFLGPIRREVGYPEDPSDPDAWPSGRNEVDLAYEYIAALENALVAERRVHRMVRLLVGSKEDAIRMLRNPKTKIEKQNIQVEREDD